MNQVEPAPALNARVVIAGALAAASGHLVLLVLMGSAVGFDALTPSLYGLAGLIANGAIFALLASRLGTAPAGSLGLVRPPAIAPLAVLLLLASLVLTSEIDNLVRAYWMPAEIRDELERLASEPAGRDAVLRAAESILIGVALFPVLYELLYRGIVQPVLIDRFGALRGIAFTAAVEAVASFLRPPNLAYDMPEVFATALVLGVLRHTSGSLPASIALHVLIGAVGIAATYRVFGIPGFDDLAAPHSPARWLISAAVCTALGLWLCARMSQTRQASRD